MKCSFLKSDLLNGINIVSKAVPVRTTMSILECILVDATGDRILLTANDMELGIETAVNGSIQEPGKIAIDAKLFSEIIRKLPDSVVILEADEMQRVVISCEKAVFHISAKDGEEFSALPDIPRDKYVVLSQFTLKEMIRQTIFSIAPNDSNKMMNGELIEVKGNRIEMTSLDGHRISIRRVELSESFDDEKIIVPGKTLSEVSKILSGEQDQEVVLYFSPNHVLFSFQNTTVVSRLVEGDYFRISQMLTTDYETKVVVNKKEMMDCIDRSILLVRENDKKPLILDIQEGNMILSMNSAMGSLQEEIAIDKSGADLMIGFNPRFLMDALKAIDEETVTLYLINSKSPCFIRDDKNSYVYLILPVNFTSSRR